MTKFRSLLALSALWGLTSAVLPVYAQNQVPRGVPRRVPNFQPPGDPTTAPVPARAAANLPTVTANDLAGLKAQLPQRYALSLRADLDEMNANPAARDALLEWVAGGGVIFLHTDAAQLFGYETVDARQEDKRVAGQLLGRARVEVPFASHPLLVNARAGRTSDPTRLPGISLVYYTMQPGDQLVVSHPAGTPLLRVTDLASNDPRTLYAAAIAPFGRGWALVTPDSVDQTRADGAAFARNLLSMVPGAIQKTFAPGWINIPLSAVEDPAALLREVNIGLAINNAVNAATPDTPDDGGAAPALPQLGTNTANATGQLPTATVQGGRTQIQAAPQVVPPPADTTPATADTTTPDATTPGAGAAQPDVSRLLDAVRARGPVLMVSRGEALAIGSALGGPNAQAVMALLDARKAILQANLDEASRALAEVPETSAEAQFILGEVAATRADNVTLSSAERAAAARSAAQYFTNAAAAQPLLAVAGVGIGEEAPSRVIFGATTAQLQGWSTEFNRMAAMFALEPPLSQTVGNGAAAITVRFFPGDPIAAGVTQAAKALANANGFGWRGDREEIILFPTQQAYQLYRNAAGLATQSVPLPAAGGGDVMGQRIVMVSSNFGPNFGVTGPIINGVQVGGVPVDGLNVNGVPLAEGFAAPVAGGFAAPALTNQPLSLLARLHAYALLGAWFDGVGRIPAWFALGLENGADVVITGNNNTAQIRFALQQVARNNALLSPAQFEASRIAPNDIAAAESASLVNYFYEEAGAGSVTGWVQRVAAGQNPDAALVDVAEGDQSQLFNQWATSQFGNQGGVLPGAMPDGDPNNDTPDGVPGGFPNDGGEGGFPGGGFPGGGFPGGGGFPDGDDQ